MAPPSEKRILVVDDEEVVCRALASMLRLDGHEVEAATTPSDAIERCKSQHFDLIFLDFFLPEMNGDQVLGILRRLNPRQRIIIISGQKAVPVLQADFFIRKPFTEETIRKAIARFA